MKRCFLGLGLFLSVTSVTAFAANIADGLEQAITDGHWTQNYGQDGYAWFGTAPDTSDPCIFFPTASQTVFGFSAQLSNGQTSQTLNFTPSYVVSAPLIELNGISEGGEPGLNYTMIDTPWPGGRMASGTAFLTNAPQGQSTPLFSFGLGGTVPNSFAFTVFLNNAAAAPSSLTLSGGNGGSATQSVASLSGLDAFTFNVSNVMPFENFTLSALAQPGQSDIAISGVTFQCFAPVPEPATTVLLLSSLALIGLFATARRLARV
jgi:hypothetical protein